MSVPVPIQTRVVVGVSLRPKQVAEHASQIGNIGLGLKFERAAVSQVFRKLRRTSLAQGRNGNGLFLFHNELVFLGGRLGLESLPWKSSLEEINQDITNRLEIISSRLFHSQVIVNGSITRSTSKRSSFTLRNVLKGTRVAITLGKTEINAIDKVTIASSTISDKVGRLDISVNQVARVHQLDTLQKLISHHQDSLERKATSALVELILQRRTKEIHHHQVVRVLGSKVMNLGKPRSVLQFTVHLVLVTKLRAAGSMLFKLDSDLIVVVGVM
mmetsp:Transcript_31907/g.77324  ORF Transcript_31907/g.77324 Transcript_31907/m.77324 type:complete len:272 (+) Transcript_31907:158-973(+)